jgi:nucleoside triphosphate diphosphatase
LRRTTRVTPAQAPPAWTAGSRGVYTRRVTSPTRGTPPAPDRDSFAAAAAELLDLVRHLSGPDGCPWDREQTPRTLTPYLVEEAHEVGEAVARGDAAAAREEVGDLFFLAAFFAVTLEREGGAAPAAVLRQIIAKMIGRHPHVFAEAQALDARGVLRQWEEGKRAEAGASSVLGERPASLPALLQAYRVQEKAASVGFDWERVEDVVAKLREEVGEVETAIRSDAAERVAEELGDLLFAAVNLARFLKIDPEAHLRIATEKFRVRFDRVVATLRERGREPGDADLLEMDRIWNEVKREERRGGPP